jgi:hypothetical protein
MQLVGSVEFRIAAASSDRKLEDLLDKYLTPLLLKLASEHLAVRNKVRTYYHVMVHLCLSIPTANSGLLFIGHLHLSAYQ